jgi:virulence factor Mce-like protein
MRERFMRWRRDSAASPLRNGAITLAVIALVLYCGFTRSVPFMGGAEGTLVRAEFATANDIDDRTPVRVGGIKVGTVESVEVAPGSRSAVVTMRIEDGDVSMRRDARAEVRWRTLLGGAVSVDLEPGSASAPLDGAIPKRRTRVQVEFDHLNQPFDGGTAEANRTIIAEFRRAFAPHAAGEAVDALGPSLATVERGIEPMHGRTADDLRRLVASSGRMADSLSRDRGRLEGLVESAATTLGVMAARRQELGELMELSPPTMDTTVATLDRLDGTLTRLDSLAPALRPGARALAPTLVAARPTLTRLTALLRESRPLLRLTPPTVESLASASRSGAPLLRRLGPTLDRLSGDLLPFLAERDSDTGLPNYTAIGANLAAIDSAASEFDGEGYWLHFSTQVDERTASTSPCQHHFTNPTEEQQLRCQQLDEVLLRILGWNPRG